MTEAIHGIQAIRAHGPIVPRWLQSVDQLVLVAVLLLFAIGLLLGMAASPVIADKVDAAAFSFVLKHGFYGAVALAIMVAISALPMKHVRRIGFLLFVASFVGLLLLPIFGTNFGKGAVRWFALGFGSVQPSEFLKPGFIILTAWLIVGSKNKDGPPGIAISGGLALAIILLLALQPDFGQASLVAFCWLVVFFVSGAPVLLLAGMVALLLAFGFVAYTQSQHLAGRIDSYISGIVEANSQLDFSISAIQQGGWFGVGVGRGTVKYHLPDGHTDFIVSVGAEEYGLLLVLAIVALFSFIAIRSLLLLARKEDPFVRLAGTGLAMLFGIQAFINMGVSIGLLPSKGLTLPLISYGGSSVVSAGILLGMMLAMTRSDPPDSPDEHLDHRGI